MRQSGGKQYRELNSWVNQIAPFRQAQDKEKDNEREGRRITKEKPPSPTDKGEERSKRRRQLEKHGPDVANDGRKREQEQENEGDPK